MEDKELNTEEELHIDEFTDLDIQEVDAEFDEVELQAPEYEVWLTLWNSENDIVDEDLLFSTTDQEEAIGYTKSCEIKDFWFTDKVAYATIDVETVVEAGEIFENIDTVYSRIIDGETKEDIKL